MSVVQQKLVILISGESFAQLLQRLLCSGMFGSVEMHQPSRSDLQRHGHLNLKNEVKGRGGW